MIKLLTKIEQDYGLPVAISFAKQAIEQNNPFARELKTNKTIINESYIIANLLAWGSTKEGHKYWGNISRTLNEVYSISYSDLEEYSTKDPNKSITLLEAMEIAEGKNITLSFCENVLSNKDTSCTLLEKLKQKELKLKCTIKEAIYSGFNWEATKEGNNFWCDIYERNLEETRYNLTMKMIEEYAKHTNIKTVTIDTIQKIKKEPKMAMIAPFKKGSLDIKGIMHQAAKGIKDDRPFVVALINKELERVRAVIKNTPRDTFNYEGYDIRVHYYVNQILAAKIRLDASIPGNICTPFINISSQLVVDFYAYEKLVKKNTNYSWIKSYLTQENMQKHELTLFKSNKLHIFIEEGYIYLKDFNKNVIYNTPVMYDKDTNKFYL